METDYYRRVIEATLEMIRVIRALILREIKTRFGKHRLGYVWALLEPMLFIAVFMVLFKYRGMLHTPGMRLEMFLITGIIPYLMFRRIQQASTNAIEQNQHLLAYPQVQVHDIILARFFLEFATYFLIFVILITGLHLYEPDSVVIDFPLGVLAGFIMMALFGLGLGLGLSALYPIFPSTQMISEALIGRPLFFLSGVFYSADMLPNVARKYLLLNPLFHTIELIRASCSPYMESTHFDPGYTLAFLFFMIFLGLLMQRALFSYGMISR